MNNTNVFDPVLVERAQKIERIVLGALLMESDAIYSVFGMVDEDYFYKPIHKIIYGQIRKFYENNDVIDLLTVANALVSNKVFNNDGGMAYLSGLTTNIAGAVHLQTHCLLLRQMYISRKALQLGMNIQQKVYNGEDIVDLIAFLNGGVDKINDLTTLNNTSQHIGAAVRKALQEVYARQDAKRAGKSVSITTGLTGLDRLIGGWRKGELIVLAARPSIGKTALMLHFAKAAARVGHHVCLYSLEMPDVSLADRMILSECDVDPVHYRDGNLTDEENKQVSRAAGTIEKLPIYIDANPEVSISYVRQDVQKKARKGECDIIMVDYLQLVDISKPQSTREREIAEVSRKAKIIAKELNVPLILLSQLNREVEKREEKEPMLADLRDSGAIEQDADIVCLIHRPAQHGQQKITIGNRQYNTSGLGFLYVKKQRNGRLGCVVYRHNSSMTQMSDYGDRDV